MYMVVRKDSIFNDANFAAIKVIYNFSSTSYLDYIPTIISWPLPPTFNYTSSAVNILSVFGMDGGLTAATFNLQL